jgi:hypothetical protein
LRNSPERASNSRSAKRNVCRDGEGPAAEVALQIGVVCVGVDGACPGQPASLSRLKLDLDGLGDGPGHLSLQGQHVAQLAFIAPRPQVTVGGGVDQLRRDAHAAARAQDRTLHHGIHAELSGDLGHRFRGARVLHHRRPRDHAQGSDLRQVGDHGIGHAVHEIVLLGLSGEILERKHGYGSDRDGRRRTTPPISCPGQREHRQQRRAQRHQGRRARGREGGLGATPGHRCRRRRLLRHGKRPCHDGRDEAIAAARQGLHEARLVGRVVQGIAQALDRAVEADLEVHERVDWPEDLAHLLPRHHLARAPEQEQEDLEGCSCRRTVSPFFRSSPERASNSKSPKR